MHVIFFFHSIHKYPSLVNLYLGKKCFSEIEEGETEEDRFIRLYHMYLLLRLDSKFRRKTSLWGIGSRNENKVRTSAPSKFPKGKVIKTKPLPSFVDMSARESKHKHKDARRDFSLYDAHAITYDYF